MAGKCHGPCIWEESASRKGLVRVIDYAYRVAGSFFISPLPIL